MRKFIVLLMIAAVASASYAASLQQGTQEIVVSGQYDPDTMSGGYLNLGLKYGQFIQDNLEVGVAGEYTDADDLGSLAEVGAFGEYNFDLGTELVPFVGAGVSYAFVDSEGSSDSEDAVVGSVAAGVKYFLAENVAIRVSVDANLASEDIYLDEEGGAEDTDYNLNIGMAFYIPNTP
jgi:opacity protein-like surface antigen